MLRQYHLHCSPLYEPHVFVDTHRPPAAGHHPKPHFHYPRFRKNLLLAHHGRDNIKTTDANLSPTRHQSQLGNLWPSLWKTEIISLVTCCLSSPRHAGGCHPVPRERHPLRSGTKVSGPQGLPNSMLNWVFNTGLNEKDKRQQPGLFWSREVLLFQLLMSLQIMHI